MSWFNDFTNKAEQLLIKLDQNAADVLHKKKETIHPIVEEVLTEVTAITEPESRKRYSPPPVRTSPAKSSLSSVKSSPNISNKLQDDEQLMKFLNSSASVEIETKQTSGMIKSNGLSVLTNGHVDPSTSDEHSVESENQMLKNEVRSLNNELSLLLHRTKAAERESEKILRQLKEAEENAILSHTEMERLRLQIASYNDQQHNLHLENERLQQMSVASTGLQTVALEEAQNRIKLLEDELNNTNNKLSAEIMELQNRLEAKENEVTQLEAKKRDVQSECDNLKQTLQNVKTESEQYRARAELVLNNKEKLIAELRKSNSDSAVDSSLEMELQQIREERSTMVEENQRLCEQYEAARTRLAEVERTLDIVREEALLKQNKLNETLAQQTRCRQIAEEDCKTRNEELYSVREELNRQCSQLNARLRDRDNELTRLRSQLTQRPASPPLLPGELEVRLSALTKTLVQKQTALESVTTERNELCFQIEELELKHRQHISKLHQGHQRHISANDTDDAKAQVPSFLVESPFDTGVTRRVKRAYSSLDAVSIRTGVFLRRYPLARIFVVFYVILLQLWVFVVLFSRTTSLDSVQH